MRLALALWYIPIVSAVRILLALRNLPLAFQGIPILWLWIPTIALGRCLANILSMMDSLTFAIILLPRSPYFFQGSFSIATAASSRFGLGNSLVLLAVDLLAVGLPAVDLLVFVLLVFVLLALDLLVFVLLVLDLLALLLRLGL